ncbi:MAG: c-type cytochrome [Gammaproteobacteria bacterium]
MKGPTHWHWPGACRQKLISGIALAVISLAAGADDLIEPGRDRYVNDCGGCHGADARGGGAVAAVLKMPPSDLTVLSRDNSGRFPEDYVRRVVDGRELPPAAHGETSMPVWGEHYKRALPGYSEAVVSAKIDALIAYLKSVQTD